MIGTGSASPPRTKLRCHWGGQPGMPDINPAVGTDVRQSCTGARRSGTGAVPVYAVPLCVQIDWH